MAAYVPQEWRNDDESTPLSAGRLTHMEEGISGAHERIDQIPDGPDIEVADGLQDDSTDAAIYRQGDGSLSVRVYNPSTERWLQLPLAWSEMAFLANVVQEVEDTIYNTVNPDIRNLEARVDALENPA